MSDEEIYEDDGRTDSIHDRDLTDFTKIDEPMLGGLEHLINAIYLGRDGTAIFVDAEGYGARTLTSTEMRAAAGRLEFYANAVDGAKGGGTP